MNILKRYIKMAIEENFEGITKKKLSPYKRKDLSIDSPYRENLLDKEDLEDKTGYVKKVDPKNRTKADIKGEIK